MFKWLKKFCNNDKPQNKLIEYFDSKYRGVTLTVNYNGTHCLDQFNVNYRNKI